MEETKELQTAYKIFRAVIYVSLLLEFFEYAIDPELLDYWGGIVCDVHDRITVLEPGIRSIWSLMQDGRFSIPLSVV